MPPLRKKNGVRNANATTRIRSCSLPVLDVVVDITSPSTNAGQRGLRVRAVAEPHEQEQAREDELDLRLDHAVAVAAEEPGRRSAAGRRSARPRRATNGTIQIVGLTNRIVSPATVAMSVTKVADIIRLPTSSRFRPVSTSTA